MFRVHILLFFNNVIKVGKSKTIRSSFKFFELLPKIALKIEGSFLNKLQCPSYYSVISIAQSLCDGNVVIHFTLVNLSLNSFNFSIFSFYGILLNVDQTT